MPKAKSSRSRSPARRSPLRRVTRSQSRSRSPAARKSPARKSPARKSPGRRSGIKKMKNKDTGYTYYVQLTGSASNPSVGDRVYQNKGSAAAAAKKAFNKKGADTQTIRMMKRGAKEVRGKGFRVYTYTVKRQMMDVPKDKIKWKAAASKTPGMVKVPFKKASAQDATYLASRPK